jgi:ribosomal subunit interface protein
MLQRFELSGVHTSIDTPLNKYTTKKIGGLYKYIPKHSRESAHVEVTLKEDKTHPSDKCTCEVNLQLPHQTINVKESSINMYSAVDIVEAKLKLKLKKYKDTYSVRSKRHIMGRFSKKMA